MKINMKKEKIKFGRMRDWTPLRMSTRLAHRLNCASMNFDRGSIDTLLPLNLPPWQQYNPQSLLLRVHNSTSGLCSSHDISPRGS